MIVGTSDTPLTKVARTREATSVTRLNGQVLITEDPRVAAEALADGHLAVLPTETVYGLGARADLPHAIARVYATKGRPADHPLIVHIRDASALDEWGADIRDYSRSLARAFWPGPLTLIVARTERAGDHVTGGQDTVALRVPAHVVMRDVLRRLADITGDASIGVAAPSANRFGRVSPTTSAHTIDELAALLGEGDVILDGGASLVGVESTIVDCTGPQPVILRPGQVSADDVEQVTGIAVGTASRVRAPGTLASHYSPLARVVIIDADQMDEHATTDATVGLLALSSIVTPAGVVRLSAPPTTADYARILYAALREADALALTTVLAVPPPSAGLGAAVIDRLTRAAALT